MSKISARIANMSSVKLALLAKQMRSQVEDVLAAEPIAIIGMGCRFPAGGDNPEAYWNALVNQVDGVVEIPPDRWDIDSVYDADMTAPGKMNTRWGGFIHDIDQFDPTFFGIAPREAHQMDPLQRIFLEVAYEALEDAGQLREEITGSQTGVFVSSYHNDYAMMQYADLDSVDPRTLTGGLHSIVANRLSFLLNLRGPSISIDTACSSSLVAVHLACQSLRDRDSNLALAGGINLIISPQLNIALTKGGFMSPDGHCRAFDAGANGFVRGEGCGVVVLKRLSDALADGDTVLALVRGSAVNQDGRSNVLTAPNGPAQQAVVQQALQNAGIDSAQISHIEAHGTGTVLGDPIEVEALTEVVGQPRPKGQVCLLTSVKTNIGHLEAAAGVAGLIKVVLSMQHEAIPSIIHFKKLNPHISLDNTPFVIPTEMTPWPAGDQPRFAGVSSFGVGGTNAHVVLEDAPRLPQLPPDESNRAYVLPLSAHNPDALAARAAQFRDLLASESFSNLRDLSYSASARRSHYDYRLSVAGQSAAQLAEQLDAFLRGEIRPETAAGQAGRPQIAFVFSGQGPQWWAMGRQLLEQEPVFREVIEQLDQLFSQYASWSLLAELKADEANSRLDQTEIAQPAIFALQVALAALWKSWGVVPQAVVGHSIGEIASAHIGGILSLEDAVRVAFHRGRLMQQATGLGKMAAVELSYQDAQQYVAPYKERLSVAAVNSPTSCTLSGEAAALEEVVAQLKTAGVMHKVMGVNYAFHSPQMAPFQRELVKALDGIKPQQAVVPVYSTVRGAVAGKGEFGANYWGENIRERVRFAESIDAMAQAGYDLFLEISPHPVLLSNIEQTLNGRGKAFSSLRRKRDERLTMLAALGGLYTAGYEPDWKALFPAGGRTITLPNYPWQRERYWLDTPTRKPARRQTDQNAHPLLGEQLRSPALQGTVFESHLSAAWPPFLNDHRIFGTAILPATAYLEMALSAGGAGASLENVVIQEALPLPEDGERTVQLILSHPTLNPSPLTGRDFETPSIEKSGDVISFQLVSLGEDGAWKRHAEGNIVKNGAIVEAHRRAPLQEIQKRCVEAGSVDAHYERFAMLGMGFGPMFYGVTQLWRGDGDEMLGLIRLPENDGGNYQFHPALLDACLQVLSEALPEDDDALYLPMSLDRLQVFAAPGTELWSYAQVRPREGRTILAGDVSLYDADGTLVAEVTGLHFKRASREAIQQTMQQNLDWFYETRWQEAAIGETQADLHGDWLILADQGGIGAELAGKLREGGGECVIVPSNSTGTTHRVAPTEDFEKALNSRDTWRGVVYLWALDAPALDDSADSLLPAQEFVISGALRIAQSLAKGGKGGNLWLVTRGAQAIQGGGAPGAVEASLWGFGSTLPLEYPDLRCVRVDLQPEASGADVKTLLDELAAPGNEDRIAYRNGERLVARLTRPAPVGEQQLELQISERGVLDNLVLRSAARPQPAAGEVEIRVHATGLNFRDVLKALGVYPGDMSFFGDECAGQVVRVGAGIEHLQVGDYVLGIATGGFNSFAIARADFMVRMPESLSFEEAASIPIAFLTAYYALHHLGNMAAGDRVLIHAAAGGVGLAAVQLAQQAGAEVFATAGNPDKRAFLSSLGVQHVMDSRSLNFADEIMTLTNGEGVDIVLNSLAGDFIPKSLSVVRQGGRFLEIGKTGIWDAGQVAAFNPGIGYHVIFLADLYDSQSDLVRSMLLDVVEAVETGALQPLPRQVFPIEDVVGAFRFMAQAKHTGKIVVTQPAPISIRPDASYLITGGLGGIGLLVAQWLVTQGVRNLALMGRSAPSAEAQAALAELAANGAQVRVAQGDVSREDDVRRVLGEIAESMPPLRGVFHAAGINDDSMLLQQDWTRFENAMRAKVDGAWHLHRLARGLDFFVLFSSIAANLGSIGQINYAAANAFLDSLAGWRRTRGLPATAINWGAWDHIGMTAAVDERDNQRRARQGLGVISPEAGMRALAEVMRRNFAQVTALPVNWPTFLGTGEQPPYFNEIAREKSAAVRAESTAAPKEPELLSRLKDAPPSKYRSILLAHIREQAAVVLGLPASMVIDGRQPLNELGLDSLMAVELRNALGRSVGTTLPATLLFDYPVVDALADYLANDVLNLQAERPVDTPAVEEAGTDLTALNELSDEEAEALLLEELMNLKKKNS